MGQHISIWTAVLKKHYYKAKGRNLDPIHDLKKLLPIAKKSKKYGWLAEYDSMALQEGLRHLKKAFDGFFAGRTGFPHFKSRRGEQSSYHCTNVSVGENWIKVPKLSAIKAVIHRPVTGKVKSITLSMDCCGDFFASILFEDGLAAPEPLKEVKENLVTADDMGLDAFFTDSNKVKVYAPKPLKKALKKVRKASRTLSRRQKGSKNREKARLRLARINRRVKRVRQDFLHKVSRKQVNESQALVFETLKVNNMVRNRRLARSIMDAAWGEYFRMTSYKAEREGKRVVCVPSIRIPQFRQQKGPLGWGFLTLLKMGGAEAPGLIFLGEGRSPSPSRFRAAASRPNRPVGASRRYACAVQR